MQLTKDQLSTLRDIAIVAATEAGRFIANYDKSTLDVQTKKGAEVGTSRSSQVVTEVDLTAQEIIVRVLHPTLHDYDLALLTEESVDDHSRFKKDYFWCIDPLDGTLPFIDSTSGYSVSIGLVSESGMPYIGVIYDPTNHKCYSAMKDCGAFCDGTIPFHVNDNNNNDAIDDGNEEQRHLFTLVNDRGLKNHTRYDEVVRKMEPIQQQILYGGSCMSAIYVVQNPPAAFFKFPKPENGGGSLWDFAAGACIVKEAGGHACDMLLGEPLDLNRPDSTFMNHRGVIIATSQQLADDIRHKFGFASFKIAAHNQSNVSVND